MSSHGSLPKTIPYHIAERVQHGIVRGRYPLGSNLREMELGAEFGSSRGPVREGLRLLELQGLVVHAPRRGFRVMDLAERDIDRLYRLRAQLEATVIEALADKDATPLAEELERLNETMRINAQSQDLESYFDNNIRFHQCIIDFADSPILLRVLSIVNDMSLPLRYMLLSENFPRTSDYEYHKKILEALGRRDFRLACHLTEAHILENLPKVKERYATWRAGR